MQVLHKIASQTEADRNDLFNKLQKVDFPGSRGSSSKKTDSRQTYQLKSGFLYVPAEPTIITSHLGSGMSVCLFDPKNKIGGMNHYEEPQSASEDKAPARFGNKALEILLKMMNRAGADMSSLQAQIYGGAFNSNYSDIDIGIDNYQLARKILDMNRIAVVALDVGGEHGRCVSFHSTTGESSIRPAFDLTGKYWYPYDSV